MVYPRVGGGTGRREAAGVGMVGLSPRGRGHRDPVASYTPIVGSIPAWAGAPTPTAYSGTSRRVYPRVGGGTPHYHLIIYGLPGLSPRGRGHPLRELLALRYIRSIPAWAGASSRSPRLAAVRRVYPRVGGGIWSTRRTGTE